MATTRCRKTLEALYRRLNRRRFVEPDPLQFLYAYPDIRDREVAGLVAATLAVGNVRAIVRSVGRALEPLGRRPARFIAKAAPETLAQVYAGFKHRFFTGDDLAGLLVAAGRVASEHGSIEACFAEGIAPGHETVVPALERFVARLSACGCGRACRNFLPDPCRRSACKRLHLYLRWMVRQDEVDPGGWQVVPASLLVVPLDVHMHRIGRAMGFTNRNAANLSAALDVTAGFRRVSPDDPVRYDFVLTRLGMHDPAALGEFLRRWHETG